jgi:hypothetical protein
MELLYQIIRCYIQIIRCYIQEDGSLDLSFIFSESAFTKFSTGLAGTMVPSVWFFILLCRLDLFRMKYIRDYALLHKAFFRF